MTPSTLIHFLSLAHGWEVAFNIYDLPFKGNIIVGNDVWFGYDSLIMNGVTIGNGAIIAARSVVKEMFLLIRLSKVILQKL